MGTQPIKITSLQILEWTVDIVKANQSNQALKAEYIGDYIKTVHETLTELANNPAN